MRISPALRIALITVTIAAATSAHAAVFTWDITPGTVGVGDSAITGGTGVWDTTNGNWTTDGGLNNVSWPAAGTDNNAVFGGTAGTVSIAAGGVTANDITFDSAYTVQNNSLTLNGTTPTITLNNVTATINSSLVLDSDAAVNINNVSALRMLDLNGGLTGTNRNLAVTVNGAGSGAFSGLQIDAVGSYSGSLSVTNSAASGQAQLGITAAVAQNALIDTDVTVNGTYFQLGNGNAGKLVQVRSLAGNNVSNNVSSDNQANTLVIGTNNNTLGSTTYSGNLTNGGGGGANLSLIKNGTATQVLAGTNTYSGSTQINGGVLQIAAATNLPSASALSFTNGAALNISAAMTLANNVTIAGGESGRIRMTGATSTTLTGNYTAMDGNLILDLSNASGFSGFIIGSANGPTGTVTVVQPNAGNSQVGLTVSTFQAFFANAIFEMPTSGNVYFAAGNGSANNISFGALDGGHTASTGAGYVGTIIGFDNRTGAVTITGTHSGSFAGTIFNGNGGGPLVVTKNGAGTQTFTGANQYTGGTLVNAGSLLISNTTGSGTGTGAVTVNGGILGGSGIISGAVTVNAGGKLSPGNSPGILTINNHVNISAAVAAANTQSMLFELGSVSDLIDMTNGTAILSIGSGVLEFDDFVFTAVTGFGVGTYTLFATDQLINGTLGSNVIGSVGGFQGTLAFAGGGTDLVLDVSEAVIPTPAALPAGLGLIGLLAARRRRR